eukprot:2202380-Amphidinium_carterae.3
MTSQRNQSWNYIMKFSKNEFAIALQYTARHGLDVNTEISCTSNLKLGVKMKVAQSWISQILSVQEFHGTSTPS